MSADADRLLEALLGSDRRRTRRTVEQLWTAFRQEVRGYTGGVGARTKLAALLEELEARGKLVQPRSSRRWDRSAEPPLPAWIRLARPPRERRDDRPPHLAVAWPPELSFVTRLPRTSLLDELLAIQRFLAEGGRQRRPVPARERSLELFGDEKRLDALQRTRLFGPGRLSLAVLRCFDVAPPLVWEARAHPTAVAGRPAPGRTGGGGERPLLVVENLHTYDTMRRVNAQRGSWCAVAYGHGSEFKATARDLPRVRALLGAERIEYFGDLDHEGLRIPLAANAALARIDAAERVEPAARLYQLLLTHGEGLRLPDSGTGAHAPDLAWLPAELREPARRILASGLRLPQELVGLDLLLD